MKKTPDTKWMIGSEILKDGQPTIDLFKEVFSSFEEAEDELLNLANTVVTQLDQGDFIGLFNSFIIFAFDGKTELTRAVYTVRFSDKLRHLRDYLNIVINNHYDKK